MTYPPGTLSAQLATLAAVGATPDELRLAAMQARRLERLIDELVAEAMEDAPPPPYDLLSAPVAGRA